MEPISRPQYRRDFRIAIICALAREADAVVLLFDNFWDDDDETSYGRVEGDLNHYTNGRMGHHDVVLAHLPEMGTQAAAAAAANLRASYTGLKVAFLVGICGGVPKIDGVDVYLGDVVISNSIIQYDYGRQYPGSFEVKQTTEDSLGPLSKDMKGLLAFLQTNREWGQLEKKAAEHLRHIQNTSTANSEAQKRWNPQTEYSNPGRRKDSLFRPDYIHRHRADCHPCRQGTCKTAAKASCSELGCKDSELVCRNGSMDEEEEYKPMIFVGRVGSGNTVMKSGADRDRIAAEHNIAMFEMEGAGVWGEIPCLVIKGVCDYADSHKTKRWQDFAAATAASVLKAMLQRYIISDRPQPSPSSSKERELPACHTIPYIRNQDIVKRQGLIDRLHQLLAQTSVYCVAVLWGLGGSGKTQIALDYAYERWDRRDTSVLWVHADTEATFIQDYKTIARKLGVKEALDGEQLLEAVRDKIEALPRWVLVIDNADDINIFHPGRHAENSMNLLQFVPRSAGKSGTLLWTSRDESAVGRLTGHGRGVEVARMADAEARELLGIKQGAGGNNGEDGQVTRLLEELGWFALAVKQAGAFMRRTSTPVGEYLAMLSEDKNRWDLFKLGETSDSHQRPGVPNSVLRTWHISIERIREENRLAYHIMHVLAYVDNQSISPAMISEAAAFRGKNVARDYKDRAEHCARLDIIEDIIPLSQNMEVVAALKRLKEYSFIQMHGEAGDKRSYEMHKLVQDAARYKLHSDASIRSKQRRVRRGKAPDCDEAYFAGIALQVISSLYPFWDNQMWQQCEKYTAHAVRVTEWAELCERPIRASGLMTRVVDFLGGRGVRMDTKALQLSERKLSLQKQALGDRHEDTFSTMHQIACIHHRLGNKRFALEMADHLHRTQRKVLGETHHQTVAALDLRAGFLNQRGDSGQAVRLLARAMDKLQDQGRATSFEAAEIMHQHANILYGNGDFDKAKKLARAALHIYKENANPKDARIFFCTGLLASCYVKAARYDKAASMYQSALTLARDRWGSKHEATAQALGSLSASLHVLSRHREAEPLAREAADIYRDLFGPEHRKTLDALSTLVSILVELDNLDDAQSLVNVYYPVALETFGPNDDCTKLWDISRRDLDAASSPPGS